jgi:hypothetical protein
MLIILVLQACVDELPSKKKDCTWDPDMVEVFFSKKSPFTRTYGTLIKAYYPDIQRDDTLYSSNYKFDWPAIEYYFDVFTCADKICAGANTHIFGSDGEIFREYHEVSSFTTYRVCEVTEDYMRLYGEDEDYDLEFFRDSTLTLMMGDSVVWAPPTITE